MNYIIFIIAILLIVSKYFDCYTTSISIKQLSEERNPLARKIMMRIGIQTTIWTIFFISILIVFLTVFILLNYYDTLLYKFIYIILGIIIIYAQIAIAHTNKTQKLNKFTRLLNKFYR